MLYQSYKHLINNPQMPYRRLPNTDASRIKALNTALEKGESLPPFKLSYSQQCLYKLQTFVPSYKQALRIQKQSFEQQVKKSNHYKEALQKARLYISHFIQVVNLAITRGELPPSTRKYYSLPADFSTVPSLKTEKEVIEIGKLLIKGETERISKGLTSITNPTIAVVKVWYEQFTDAYNYQKTLQNNNKLRLEKLVQLRSEANNLILMVWNEVEEHYKDLPEDMKREKASEYGLVYIFRKSENEKLRYMTTKHKDIG